MRKEDLTLDDVNKFMAQNFPSSQVVEKLDDGILIQTGTAIQKIGHEALVGYVNQQNLSLQTKGNMHRGLSDQGLGEEYSRNLRELGIPESIKSPVELTELHRLSAIQSGIDGSKLESMITGRARIIEANEASKLAWERSEAQLVPSNETRANPEARMATEKAELIASHGLTAPEVPGYNYGTPRNAASGK